MKILLVAHFFPPNHGAGAEKRTLGYALALQKLGHQVQVVCAGDWDAGGKHWNGVADEVFQGVPVRRVNLNWTQARDPNRSLYDNSLVEEYFADWLAEWQPDLLHLISLMTLGAGVVRAAKKLGIPVVFTLVDFWMICPKISLVRGNGSLCDGQTTPWDCLECLLWDTKVRRALAKLLPDRIMAAALTSASRTPLLSRQRGLRGMALDMADRRRVLAEIAPLVDCVTAPSTSLGRVIDETHLFPQPVRIVHSGHDLTWVNTMPVKQPSDELRLGYIGQLIPQKGVDLLIRAFQDAAHGKRAALLIYGDADSQPDYAVSLKEMVQSKDSIRFLGPFPHDRLGEVMAGLDLLVVPSQWHENNPRVIQEAFAAQIPVIASSVGGIAEFIQHDVNGFLFQHDRVEDLSKWIRVVLDEPVVLSRLQKGIRPVKTIDNEMQEFCDIYASLLEPAIHRN